MPQTTPPPSSQKIEPPRSTEVSKAPPADYQPPKTVDPKLAALVDRRAPEDARISSDISARLPRVQNAADFPALIQVLSDAQDDDTVRNEVANLLRRSGYFTGTAETLMKVLDNPAEKARFRSFAVQHLYGCLEDNKNSAPQPAHPPGQGALVHPDYTLSAEEQQKITDHLHTYLTDRDVEVRREALLALVRLKDPLAAPTAVAWLNQPGPEADRSRDLAIRCVHDLDLRDQIPTIRKYAHDPNEVIRIAAIVALSEWNDEESRPAFEEAAQSKVERLKRAGKAALARLKTDAK
ncbi:MAG: HEAT repeat domain-containing protein [Planctomycetota bacterium]